MGPLQKTICFLLLQDIIISLGLRSMAEEGEQKERERKGNSASDS
jgi:hypothetical protein